MSMSLNNVPSKMEVMGWSPQSLAEYMSRLKLSGCDKVVMRGNITGAQFMQMTECDLQVFPHLYIIIITKIQSEINKGDQKSASGYTSKAQKYPKQVCVQDEEDWESDEFDNESDTDYEDQNQEEGDDNYVCTLTEPQTAEQQDSDQRYDDNYKPPSPADPVKSPRHRRAANVQDSAYRGPVPAERTSKPSYPRPPRMNDTPQRTSRAPASPPTLHIDRSKKPGPSGPTQKGKKSKGSAVKAPGPSTSKMPLPRTIKPPDVFNRAWKIIPAPPVPKQLAKINHSIPGAAKGFDPSWYGGKVTRHQAEAALREVNEDGAFVVRDSSKGSVEHPYTLMLLNQGKVYNIKIRNQGNSYSLGTGFSNTKSFPGVTEMITHHAHTPLLLIDATDQSSKAQSQCCLLYPAGL